MTRCVIVKMNHDSVWHLTIAPMLCQLWAQGYKSLRDSDRRLTIARPLQPSFDVSVQQTKEDRHALLKEGSLSRSSLLGCKAKDWSEDGLLHHYRFFPARDNLCRIRSGAIG